jgi:hypothetical protein
MNWYYAENNQQKGPVSEDEMKRLVAIGTVTPQTLVWHEGLANWAAYSTVATELAAAAPATEAPDIGVTHRAERAQTNDPEDLARRIDEHGYDFTIGSVIGRAWELVKGNLWPSIGITLLCYLIMMGAGYVPLVGIAATFLVQPQILAGLYWYFLKQFRGEEATLNDAFDGFRRGFGQQAIYMLIMFGVMMACVLPVVVASLFFTKMSHVPHGSPPVMPALPLLPLLMIIIVGLVVFYLTVCWCMAPLLILDKGLKATEAMRLSRHAVQLRFWKIVGLFLVMALLSMLGALALLVGIIVVLPVAFATVARLYEDIFGEPSRHPSA